MIDFRLLLRFKGQKISKPNCGVDNSDKKRKKYLPDSGLNSQNGSNPRVV